MSDSENPTHLLETERLPTEPRDSSYLAYLAGAGIASVVLAASLEERLGLSAFDSLFGCFFFLFLALGAVILGWWMRVLKGASLFAALCIANSGVFLIFGFKVLMQFLGVLWVVSTLVNLFTRYRAKRRRVEKAAPEAESGEQLRRGAADPGS
jgi:hypothetical protein